MEKSHNEKTDTVKYLVDQNKIIGWYRYSLWPRGKEETTTAHTLDIAILPSYQKQGLGTFLMKDMIKDCKNKGIKKVTIQVQSSTINQNQVGGDLSEGSSDEE